MRHGIVLALAGLLAGLGIVATLFWDGDVHPGSDSAAQGSATQGPAAQGTAPDDTGSRAALADPSASAPRGEAAPSAEDRADRAATPAAPPATGAEPPRFDIVRVEPNGEAVIAGRGKPNTVVEMLVDGRPVARALADPTGQFAIVPPPLPKGSSEIVLRAKSADGQETRSPQSVAVSIAPNGDSQPLVALTRPDAPTVVLSQPGAPETREASGSQGQDPQARAARTDAARTQASRAEGASGPASEASRREADAAPPARAAEAPAASFRIVSVDGEGGRLFVTGLGTPGTEVRLYLNDTLITPASVGPDGRVTFTIGRGMSAGRYRIRIEEVDPRTGKVAHRAEVGFTMPEAVAGRADTRQAAAPAEAPPAPGKEAKAGANAPAGAASRGEAAPGRDRVPEKGMAALGASSEGKGGTAGSGEAAGAPRPGAVFVPAITTARITRGDNLWQISKRTYGRGQRYTVIYDANQDQIRDPDLIYPGQTFVLPPNERRG